MFVVALIIIFSSVSSYIFDRDKSAKKFLTIGEKEEKGYSRWAKEKEIKEGIKVHFIKNDRFKTNLIAVFLSLPLERENVTKNATYVAQ